MKKVVFILLFTVLLFVLSGCMPGDGTYTAEKPAGFFWGVWHGWIAPFSLIISIFNKNIRIYEPINTGWIYDFGFYIAVIGGFGGAALFRKKDNKK